MEYYLYVYIYINLQNYHKLGFCFGIMKCRLMIIIIIILHKATT